MSHCVIGIGCRADVSASTLREIFGLLPADHVPDAIATLAERAALPALRDLALETGLPLIAIPREAIAGIATPTQSPRILESFGTGSVAEAVALAAINGPASIALPRQISPDGSASAAIAIRTLS